MSLFFVSTSGRSVKIIYSKKKIPLKSLFVKKGICLLGISSFEKRGKREFLNFFWLAVKNPVMLRFR
jgi:hypothetical protein